jgi:hypothetical protein
MILTVDISEALHKRLEMEKRKTGLNKSQLVRSALHAAFMEARIPAKLLKEGSL